MSHGPHDTLVIDTANGIVGGARIDSSPYSAAQLLEIGEIEAILIEIGPFGIDDTLSGIKAALEEIRDRL